MSQVVVEQLIINYDDGPYMYATLNMYSENNDIKELANTLTSYMNLSFNKTKEGYWFADEFVLGLSTHNNLYSHKLEVYSSNNRQINVSSNEDILYTFKMLNTDSVNIKVYNLDKTELFFTISFTIPSSAFAFCESL